MTPARLQGLIDEIRDIEDRDLRSDLLIEFSERFIEVPANIAVRPFPESHKAPACESEAYVWIVQNPDRSLKLYFAVENPQGISAKALAVILDEALSGSSAQEILEVSEDIVYDIFGRNITMGKGQGLMGMVRIVKELVNRCA